MGPLPSTFLPSLWSATTSSRSSSTSPARRRTGRGTLLACGTPTREAFASFATAISGRGFRANDGLPGDGRRVLETDVDARILVLRCAVVTCEACRLEKKTDDK